MLAPVAKMYTLGHDFIPTGIHAGGLRYHGDSPIISKLVNEKMMEAVAYDQKPVFEAAMTLRQDRGHHPRARNRPCHQLRD